MINAQDWWNVFINYNKTIYPMQFFVMAGALGLVLWLFIKPSKTANTMMLAFLSICNIWNGTMFFIVLGQDLPSPLRFIQGGLFLAIGILLGIDSILGKTKLSLPQKPIIRNLTVIFLLLTATYPLIGLMRGHSIFQLVYPGTLPCGTAALSLIMLSTALPKTNKAACVLLLIWAIPFAPFIQIPVFKVYEDAIMFIVGIYVLITFIVQLKKQLNKKIL